MKKNYLICILIISVIILTLSLKNEPDEKALRIGTMPTLTASIYVIGIEKGFFEKYNVPIDLKIYKSAIERDSAMVAGELDGVMTDMMGAINLIEQGFELKITSSEYENFGVMANKDVTGEVSKILTEQRIGISNNTVTEYIVDALLENHKIQKVNIQKIPDRMAAVLNNEIPLGVFPEPFISMIKFEGGRELISSQKEGIQPVVMTFTIDAIKEKDTKIVAFYLAYNDIVKYMKETPHKEYKDLLISYGVVSDELLDSIILPVEQFSYAKLPTEKDFKSVISWMNSKDMITKAYSFEEVTLSKYIK